MELIRATDLMPRSRQRGPIQCAGRSHAGDPMVDKAVDFEAGPGDCYSVYCLDCLRRAVKLIENDRDRTTDTRVIEIVSKFLADFSLDAVAHDHRTWKQPDDATKGLVERLAREGYHVVKR